MTESAPYVDISNIEIWLREAGKIALNAQKAIRINTKSDQSIVTNADENVESFLAEQISHSYPNHQILAEEGGRIHRSNNDFLWVLDPIDGTRAFASGLPIWGISIGVFYMGKPYAGGLYMPATGEIYLASNSNGVSFNNEQIAQLEDVDLQSVTSFIAVPSNSHLLYKISFPRLRSLGSTAAHLAYVSRGLAIAALTRCVRIWDIAGVLPILSMTGVGMTYLSGKPFQYEDVLDGKISPEPIIAAPKNLLEQVRALIEIKGNY